MLDSSPGALKTFAPRKRPPRQRLHGSFCDLEPICDDRRFPELLTAFSLGDRESRFRYLPYGPFADLQDFSVTAGRYYLSPDIDAYAVIRNGDESASGVATLMRADPANGVIEVGHVCFGEGLARTVAATEAVYLLAGLVFDELGYRRFEWKCDSRNAASRRAADRLGFVYEGTFRQHMIVKGENRDTAWFSIVDHEWPEVRAALETFLAPENFDSASEQRRSLGSIRATLGS